jgi:clan AA aspartic protease (TIGR02281 family)
MRPRTLLAACLLHLGAAAQPLLTKDGVELGDRNDFIRSCNQAAGTAMMDLDGFDIDTRRYCACVCDVLIPALTMKELSDMGDDRRAWEDLMLSDRFLDSILACATDNMHVEDDANVGQMASSDMSRRLFMIKCREGALAELDPGPWAEHFADAYCACALDRLIAADLDYSELMRADNHDERAFNEVIMPCVNEATKDLKDLEHALRPGGVEDCDRSVVPLVDLLGQGYNLKLSFAGVVRYFLLDTGASDLIIDSELAAELRRKGLLTATNGPDQLSTYTLANGEQVRGRMVLISEVVIGDCRVEDVVAAVVEGGSLLCGRSFLDRFSHWEISGSAGELLLER